ncbi:interferon-induced protein 44-like isoform X2 [Heterodontus francisci]
MPLVKSRLTTENQKRLSQLLGKVNLHLLYKASVHGFYAKSFHDKCDNQGPTLTVGYNKSGFIFGGYTTADFDSCGRVVDNQAFLFRLTPSVLGGKSLKFAVKPDATAVVNNSDNGPNFGNSLLFLLNDNTLTCNLGQSYSFDKSELFGNDVNLVECEVYRVEELRTPWRNITWTTKRRQELMDYIRNYKPYGSSASKARVLLIGPIGGGKTSFINSANSVFRGHVTSRCLAGSGTTSSTTMYSPYSFRAGKDGISHPLILCDTMGLAENTESGIHSDDIISIINGHVPNKYQFNAASPIQADTKGYIKSVTAAAKIHCVAYVIDANKTTMLSTKMEKKIRAIRSQINQLEIPQIVLLTKVDEECPMVGKDVENIYQSELIEKKVLDVGQQLGIPVTCIIPVKNYWSDHELHCATDILILTALVQLLRYADDYFENLDNSSLKL